MDMRGLSKVISEIRQAAVKGKEEEQKVIERELFKVRQKFKETKNMKGYDRKKNVCKLLYIFMLGYEVDFGQMEAVQLLTSDKYSEKHIGYLACTLFLNENDELITLITHSVQQDLIGGQQTGALSKDREYAQCLALTALANVGGKDFADAMADDVRRIVCSRNSSQFVIEKALLTLLRLYRSSPERIDVEEVAPQILEFLGKSNLSLINSALSLVLGLVGKHRQTLAPAVPKVIKILYRLILSKELGPELYYSIPSPWTQVKCFRFLQHFDMPAEGSLITSVLNKIILTSERVLREQKHQPTRGTPARNNAMNAVLAEAINLVMYWDKDKELLNMSGGILVRFISDTKDANLRYIGLDLLAKLSYCPDVFHEHVQKNQQATIVSSLRDPDISIRRKALDLLYVMCDKSNAAEIVGEMLDYLPTAEYSIKEELVIKIAILCERYAADYSWYIDVILNIISQAGDFVSPDVWQRVIHIVTNNIDTQKHAVTTVFRAISVPHAHEVAVKVASHVLGEFGSLLPDTPETNSTAQFTALHNKWGLVGPSTKTLLLSCYAKFYTQYADSPALRDRIRKIFEHNSSHVDVEIQQRAAEYRNMVNTSVVSEDTLQKVFENMPAFDVDVSRAQQKAVNRGAESTDSNIWQAKREEREQDIIASRKKDQDQREEIRQQTAHVWIAEAQSTAFQVSAHDLVRAGVVHSFNVNRLGCWPGPAPSVTQDYANLRKYADAEAAKSEPKMHSDAVLLKIGEEAVVRWQDGLLQQIDSAYDEQSNRLGLAGSGPDVLAQVQEEVANRGRALGEMLKQLFPRHAEKASVSAASDFDAIFGGPAPPAAAAAAPAAAPAAPAPSNFLDDIFGGPTPQQQQQQQQPQASAAAAGASLDDIFGGPPPAAAAPPQPVAAAGSWSDPAALNAMATVNLPRLLAAPQGVLYEDERMQIAVRGQFQGSEGQVSLFIGNKTQQPFTNAALHVDPLPNLVASMAEPLPNQIFGGKQIQHNVNFSCERFYNGMPTATLSFITMGQQFRLQTQFPVPANKFMQPLELTGPQFFQAWQATQSAAPQQIYRSNRDIDLNGCQALMTNSMKMRVLRAVDDNQNNMVGAAYFTPQPWNQAAPPKQQFVVLCNVETNPGAKATRVTLKSPVTEMETLLHGVFKKYFEQG